jgi:trk system potassium uptake protein TrkH
VKKLNFKIIFQIIGIFTIVEAIAIFLCVIATVYYNENYKAILYASGITGSIGIVLYSLFKNAPKDIGKREGYIIVTFAWLFFSIFGALPYVISGSMPNFADAFFESMSGFTTTGASILSDIEALPKDILLWRSLTQWLGGMGIIVLSLAIIPLLGIGGMQLYAAEVPGPTKDKIHPKVKDTAQRLYLIYVSFTLLETLLLMIGGMSFFDALNHSFTTMATGGFSTYNTSLVHVSPYIQYVVIAFMFLAGVNFTLSYFAFHGKFERVWNNEEFRSYTLIIILFTCIVACIIGYQQYVANHSIVGIEKIIRDSLFQVVSLCTTTGFASANYLVWPAAAIMLCFMLLFFGGSAGSTGGGMKVVRIVILAKHSYLELKRLVHPSAIIPVRLNNVTVPEKVITNVLAFIVIYIIVFVMGVLLMSFLHYDFETSLGAVASAIGNVGPGIGKVGPYDNYGFICNSGKYLLSFLMLCGRLELFTVLILFSPAFWRK